MRVKASLIPYLRVSLEANASLRRTISSLPHFEHEKNLILVWVGLLCRIFFNPTWNVAFLFLIRREDVKNLNFCNDYEVSLFAPVWYVEENLYSHTLRHCNKFEKFTWKYLVNVLTHISSFFSICFFYYLWKGTTSKSEI